MDEGHENKLKELIQDLAQLINVVLRRSPELQSAIHEIEEKGYEVDLVLASMTRVKEDPPLDTPETTEANPGRFDREFLKTNRIRFDVPFRT